MLEFAGCLSIADRSKLTGFSFQFYVLPSALLVETLQTISADLDSFIRSIVPVNSVLLILRVLLVFASVKPSAFLVYTTLWVEAIFADVRH